MGGKTAVATKHLMAMFEWVFSLSQPLPPPLTNAAATASDSAVVSPNRVPIISILSNKENSSKDSITDRSPQTAHSVSFAPSPSVSFANSDLADSSNIEDGGVSDSAGGSSSSSSKEAPKNGALTLEVFARVLREFDWDDLKTPRMLKVSHKCRK